MKILQSLSEHSLVPSKLVEEELPVDVAHMSRNSRMHHRRTSYVLTHAQESNAEFTLRLLAAQGLTITLATESLSGEILMDESIPSRSWAHSEWAIQDRMSQILGRLRQARMYGSDESATRSYDQLAPVLPGSYSSRLKITLEQLRMAAENYGMRLAIVSAESPLSDMSRTITHQNYKKRPNTFIQFFDSVIQSCTDENSAEFTPRKDENFAPFLDRLHFSDLIMSVERADGERIRIAHPSDFTIIVDEFEKRLGRERLKNALGLSDDQFELMKQRPGGFRISQILNVIEVCGLTSTPLRQNARRHIDVVNSAPLTMRL